MTPEKAQGIYNRLENDIRNAQNFVAQGNSRYIKLTVKEPIESILRTQYRLNLDSGLDNLAFSYLSIGCCFAENQSVSNAIPALEKAARILEYNHLPEGNRYFHSRYCLLISALSYYTAGQYSAAFVILTQIEEFGEPIGKIASLFLKKSFIPLNEALNEVLLNEKYANDNNSVHAILFAKAIAHLVEYILTGSEHDLDSSLDILKDLQELLLIDQEPSSWWVARLFRIIVERIGVSSLWASIPPLIPEDSNKEIINKFIKGLIFRSKPATELFRSQLEVLPKVLRDSGSVVCLPTSGGKTRVAEIAILECLSRDPSAKVLYLAPFRSLAWEVETNLEETFEPCGIEVSFLYGNSNLNATDRSLLESSQILIATTEKAKAILRANEVIASSIKLVIVDEGHLIGEEDRYLRSELFIEELRKYLKGKQGKIIILSAVLPNAVDIAKWIAKDENQVAKSDWRPSRQRTGILKRTSERNIRIDWVGNIETYNENFAPPYNKKFNDKREAIAATSVKLSQIGAVLVFIAQARYINDYAKKIMAALQSTGELHEWKNKSDWEIFKLVCRDYYSEDELIIKAAQIGVICHSNKLPEAVRYAIERLMRQGNPKIIIATSTLAQGVNIGVSSVIIAETMIGQNHYLSSSDFWNIAGRAGRAFIDTEGKILCAVDTMVSPKRTQKKIEQDIYFANEYLKNPKLENAYSGLLKHIFKIKEISNECNIDFSELLSLIAENNLSKFKNEITVINSTFDLLDDTLLALDIAFNNFEIEQSNWIDDHFRESLAAVQATSLYQDLPIDDVIFFLKARNIFIKTNSGSHDNWRKLSATSLPLQSAIYLSSLLPNIEIVIGNFQNSKKQIDDLILLLENIENIIHQLPSKEFKEFQPSTLSNIRVKWIKGERLNDKEQKIVSKYFTYYIPWALGAIAQSFISDKPEVALTIEHLALSCEVGVPDVLSAHIYICGIRSRVSAIELSSKMKDDSQYEALGIKKLSNAIVENIEHLKDGMSANTRQWLNIFYAAYSKKKKKIKEISPIEISLNGYKFSNKKLYLRSLGESFYLCSPDYTEKLPIIYDEVFKSIVNRTDIWFEKATSGNWIAIQGN